MSAAPAASFRYHLGGALHEDADRWIPESGEVAVSYGVRRKYLTPVKRATFVIGTDR